MKITTPASKIYGAAAAIAGFCAVSATAQVVVYDNAVTPLNQYFSSQREFGDEISVGAGWVAYRFQFEFYSENLSGNEVAKVRFYRNDGLPVGEGVTGQAPGSLLYESTPIPLLFSNGTPINGNYPIIIDNLQPLNILLPEKFTWSVKVDGLDAGETFALKLYDPPAVGSSLGDFWHFTTDGWQLQTIEGVNANFGAVLTAVPEPGTLALLGIGGLALLAGRRSSRR